MKIEIPDTALDNYYRNIWEESYGWDPIDGPEDNDYMEEQEDEERYD